MKKSDLKWVAGLMADAIFNTNSFGKSGLQQMNSYYYGQVYAYAMVILNLGDVDIRFDVAHIKDEATGFKTQMIKEVIIGVESVSVIDLNWSEIKEVITEKIVKKSS